MVLFTGRYIYTEASSPRRPNDKARITSVIYPGTTAGDCVTFYYHMSGSGMGQLNLYMKSSSAAVNRTVWSLRGDQGDSWKLAEASVTSDSPYQVSGKICYSDFLIAIGGFGVKNYPTVMNNFFYHFSLCMYLINK